MMEICIPFLHTVQLIHKSDTTPVIINFWSSIIPIIPQVLVVTRVTERRLTTHMIAKKIKSVEVVYHLH